MRGAAAAVTVLLVAGGFALSVIGLDRFPPVHQDEPWIASVGAQLATSGSWGTPLFTGYYGAERHTFMFPPLLPLLEAATFRLAGVDTVTMRIPGVLAALAILILAALIANRAAGPWCGVLVVGLLVLLAPAGGWNNTSGVPLLDIARVARYDILVPAFGLAAFLAFERATARDARAWWLASGLLAGLGAVAHVYGLFWLLGLLLILATRRPPARGRRTAVTLICAGFAIVLAPVLITMAMHWSDFVGQQQILEDRYNILDPGFLAGNVLREPVRYRPLLTRADPLGWSLLRPGLWIALAGTTLALMHAFRRRSSPTTLAIAIILSTQVALFAILIRVKTFSYLISVWPLAALLIAITITRLWSDRRDPEQQTPPSRDTGEAGMGHAAAYVRRMMGSGHTARHAVARAALVLVLVAGFIEGGLRIRRWIGRMGETTRYADFGIRLAAHVPEGAHVLGLHQWWLALHTHEFTSWLLPVWWADPRFTSTPVSFDRALERIAPDVVLLDDAMTGYLAALADPVHPDHARYGAWQSWVTTRNLELVATVSDPTYGTIEIRGLRGPDR